MQRLHLLALILATVAAAKDQTLFVPQNGALKIAVFADLHYGENAWEDWGPEQDRRSSLVMSYVLDEEHPDFVIFLGDVVTANNLPLPNVSEYWDAALRPTEVRGIPWASVFGNHDDAAFEWPLEWFVSGIPGFPFQEISGGSNTCTWRHTNFCGVTRMELANHEVQKALSFTSLGPDELGPSITNFVIPVLSTDNPGRTVAFLYFLDSGGGSYPEIISTNQVSWFHKLSSQKNPDERVPEIIFWHIPTEAFKDAGPQSHHLIQSPCVGTINYERVASQIRELGLMDMLKERQSVKVVIVGHNHGLDWCCPYYSMWLCFARHTGYGGYGSWTRGARILEIKEDPFQLKTWIRLENTTMTSMLSLVSLSS